MLDIHIPDIKHRIYKKTFLHSVTVKINHSEVKDWELYTAALKNLFKTKYNVEIEEGKFGLLKFKSINVKSAKSKFNIKINSDFIQIKIDGTAYESFSKSLMIHCSNFISLLADSDIKIQKISVEKLNVWPVKLNNPSDLSAPLNEIFSKSVNSLLPDDFSQNNLKVTTEISFNGSQNSDLYLVSSGWLIDEEDSKNCFLILDTEAICNSPVEPENKLNYMNQVLFNLYHWSVSDKIIKLMEE